MFPTNSSAFGMKPATPITTNPLFGAPKPAGGSLFGNPAAPQQQQQPSTSTSGFGNAPPLGQSQAPATGLFGGGGFGGNTQQQQPAAGGGGGGGLFGQQTQQPAAGGGLFGQPAQQQQQQAGGGLFGQPAQQQQQQPTGGGLFGQPAQQQQQQQPAGGGGLFGQPTQQQQQQPQQQQNAFGSLFGGNNANTNNQQPQQGGFGGFGGQQQQQQLQQQPQQQQGLFSTSTLQPQPTVAAGGFGPSFGGGFLGNRSQAPQQQQQQQPHGFGLSTLAPPSGPPPFTKSTKFNDLPDDLKRELENIDSIIQSRVQISKDLHQRKLGEEAVKGQELIRGVYKELVNTSTTTRKDLHHTQDLKRKIDQAVEDTIIAMRIVDEFKNPQGRGHHLKDYAGFPLEYFTRVTEQMKERLTWYKSTIEQIERKLSSTTLTTQSPQAISATLQAQHTTFLGFAAKTATLDADLQKVKALYTQLWRAQTGSVRDPFNDIDRAVEKGGDFGMGGLNVSTK